MGRIRNVCYYRLHGEFGRLPRTSVLQAGIAISTTITSTRKWMRYGAKNSFKNNTFSIRACCPKKIGKFPKFGFWGPRDLFQGRSARAPASKTPSLSSLWRILTLNAPQSSSVAGSSGTTTRRQKQRAEVCFRSVVSQVSQEPSACGFLRGPVARSSPIIHTRIARHHLKSFITTDPGKSAFEMATKSATRVRERLGFWRKALLQTSSF